MTPPGIGLSSHQIRAARCVIRKGARKFTAMVKIPVFKRDLKQAAPLEDRSAVDYNVQASEAFLQRRQRVYLPPRRG